MAGWHNTTSQPRGDAADKLRRSFAHCRRRDSDWPQGPSISGGSSSSGGSLARQIDSSGLVSASVARWGSACQFGQRLRQGFGRPGPATRAGRVHARLSAGPSRSGRRSTGAWSASAAICSRRWRRLVAPPSTLRSARAPNRRSDGPGGPASPCVSALYRCGAPRRGASLARAGCRAERRGGMSRGRPGEGLVPNAKRIPVYTGAGSGPRSGGSLLDVPAWIRHSGTQCRVPKPIQPHQNPP